MSDPIVIVGSGASGVHFAQSVVEAGRQVLMLDVGHAAPAPVRPEDTLDELKTRLDDPIDYFLGDDYRSLILPGHEGEYYGFPPGKDYVFRHPRGFAHRASGFAPLFSFASGGLAEAWTGGSYPLTEAELAASPYGAEELARYYDLVAQRIGISGVEDDLAPFFPRHAGLLEPLELDAHARALLDAYERARDRVQGKLGCFIGRARLATTTREHGGRPGCSYLGRCLWGCPTKSLYTPSVTLRALSERENFGYTPGMHVRHFEFDDGGRVRKVVAHEVESGATREFDVGTLVLAAGTLCTSKIFLDSVQRGGSEVSELGGLTDNRQVLMPFVNLGLVGAKFDPNTYQYHQLAMALAADDPRDHVHGLVTTLKTALIHPIVQSIPASLRTSLGVFRSLHAALGLVNINFADFRREANRVGVESGPAGEPSRLVVQYTPDPQEPARIARALRTFRRVLRALGCVAPKGMTHERPMGASVHYSGTLPMMADGGETTVDGNGRSRAFENLYIVDGATFPSLPAKNLTFTLMAHAARIADRFLEA